MIFWHEDYYVRQRFRDLFTRTATTQGESSLQADGDN